MSTPFHRIVCLAQVQQVAQKYGVQVAAQVAFDLDVPFRQAHAVLLPFCHRGFKPLELVERLN